MFQTLFLSVALCFGADVDNLVRQLGSEDFQARERAHAKLTLGMDFARYAKLRDADTDNAEAEGRKRSIMEVFEQKTFKKFKPKFRVDLGDYPKFPWICQGFAEDYRWQGAKRDEVIVRYVDYAKNRGGVGLWGNCPPDWGYYRLATEIWTDDRIELAFKDAMAVAKTEEEFCSSMEKFMRPIHADVKAMIRGEDQWYGDGPNPLRLTRKKKN